MASRIAVMRAGQLEQIGTPAEIYARPASRFVAEFFGDINIFQGDAEAERELFQDSDDVRGGASDVAIAIRPERISLAADTGAPTSGIAGIIDDFAFRGSDTLYRVRLASGRFLRVVAANSGEGGRFQPGDKVRMHVPRDACISLHQGPTQTLRGNAL
jgi:ABC-type Fe3+/spermidine/putrescine transport system ATPase subunit